jgi:NAD(P)-dependent dehydrogenase (short-subunit alcohol dehydrogenase family)
MSVDEWKFTIDVNLAAPFILSNAFLEDMKEIGRGSIINVTSRSAEIGFVAEIGYCPSKFAIEGLTQCLALELQQYNIAVNSLNVGAPEGKRLKPTELTLKEAAEMPEEVKSRYATDEELVETFTDAWTFLALQGGKGVSGQRLGSKQLAEYLKRYGWEAAKANWSKKLTQAVYVTYDWPKSVRYQTPEGGIKELKFSF